MSASNMATSTASLERSLQNCSLNQSSSGSGGFGSSSTSDSPGNQNFSNISDTRLELNSQISLPYHWEQCLDLKTGEIYFINWRTGMKTKNDPRITAEFSGDFYSENDSSYDSEGSSSESSPPSSSREQYNYHHHHQQEQTQKDDQVLVVAGCKSCLMYFMVPKQVEDCPKCNGHLLHFDRSGNASP